MKKLMTAMAACAVASLSLADGSGVTSANTVGYQQVTLSAGNNLIGNNWLAVGDANGGKVKINEFLADPQGQIFYGTNLTANADKLQVWNGTGYDIYNFFKKSDGTVVGWRAGTASSATTNYINLAAGFWIQKKGLPGTKLTLAGEVDDAGAVAQTVKVGNNLLGSAYPVSMSINSTNFNWTSICYGTNLTANADKLQVWNGTGYNIYNYFKKSDGTVVGWRAGTASTATTDTIPTGVGFWYQRKAAAGGSATFIQTKNF